MIEHTQASDVHQIDSQERDLLETALAALLHASSVLAQTIGAVQYDADKALPTVRALNETLAVATWHLELYALKRIPAAGSA
jgi:hypothetical protein